jgi:hypothetical protein
MNIFLNRAEQSYKQLSDPLQANQNVLHTTSPVVTAFTAVAGIACGEDGNSFDFFVSKITARNSWNVFWDWIVTAAGVCISYDYDPAFPTDLHRIIDELVAQIIVEAPSLRERLASRKSQLCPTFLQMWLADPTRHTMSTVFPFLVAHHILSPEDLLSAFDNSIEDLAKAIISYMSFLGDCILGYVDAQPDPPLYPILLMLWGPLSNSIRKLREHLMLNGAVPLFVNIAGYLLDREISEYEAGDMLSSDEEISAFGYLLVIIINTVSWGPEYLVQAIDHNFLNIILDTGVYWKQGYSSQNLDQLEKIISVSLDVFQEHAFHCYVWRHIKMHLHTSDSSHPLIQSAAFYDYWKDVRQRLRLAYYIYDDYKKKGPNPCANHSVRFVPP